jgi:hypothetical protein
MQSESISLVLYDLIGNEVYRADNVQGDRHIIETASFGGGVYLLVLQITQQGGSIIHAQKLVVA